MKKFIYLILLNLSAVHAADNRCDYHEAAIKQKELLEKIAKSEIDLSSRLILEASRPFDENEEIEKKVRKLKLKLATEKFVKHQYLQDVSEEMTRTLYLVDSLETLKEFHDHATKGKFLLKNSAKVLKAWMAGMMVNTASMKNLKIELRNEIIESAIKTLVGGQMPKMSAEEALLFTYMTDISVKAGMDIGAKLLAGQSIRYGGSQMFLKWAGGPTGVILMVAPLFLSGTLPPETKWTDLLDKYPELILNPDLMAQTGIVHDTKTALLIHCRAWTRREIFMNRRGDQIIANEKKRIDNAIQSIYNEREWMAELERSKYARRDNTYVKPYIKPLKASGR